MAKMHIGYLFNNDMFAEMACVSMCSLLENRKNEIEIVFHLFAVNISDGYTDKIAGISSKYDKVELYFHDFTIDDDIGKMFGGPKGAPSWPKEIFARVLLPDLLPNVDRLLFLDGDTVIEDDITQLWQIDLGDALAAMVPNYWIEPKYITEAKMIALGIEQNEVYFNTGVMLMDLKGLRELQLAKVVAENINRLHEKVTEAGLVWIPEQDCQNFALDGKIKRLPMKYNSYFWISQLSDDSIDDCTEALSKPVVTHFLGPSKPMQFGSALYPMPGWECYFRYKAMSPFADKNDEQKIAAYKRRERDTLNALKPHTDINCVRWYNIYFSKQMFELALLRYKAGMRKKIFVWGLNDRTWTLAVFLAAHGQEVKGIVDGLGANQGVKVFDYAVEPPEILRRAAGGTFVMLDMRSYDIARQIMAQLRSWGYSEDDFCYVYAPIWEGTGD